MKSLIIIASFYLLLFPSLVHSVEQKLQHRATNSAKKNQPSKKPDRSQPFDFSGTGRPGQQTAGESRSSCSSQIKPIEAVLPKSNSGSTVSAHPRLWVYFPGSTAKQIETEFIIQDELRQDFWRSRSRLAASGYQSFGLPTTAAPLPVGRWYRWYVKVYCGEESTSAQYVQGWIRRVSQTTQLQAELQQERQKHHLTYGNHRIWYDAMDRLLVEYHGNPHSPILKRDWYSLTRAKGVELHRLPDLGSKNNRQAIAN